MIKVYGLKNCDTCRKALKWLEAEGVEAAFHDFRKQGLEAPVLGRWVEKAGWETLLNRRGTTWRKLEEADKADVTETKARALMLEHTSLIKRPVIEIGDEVLVGFKEQEQAAIKAAR